MRLRSDWRLGDCGYGRMEAERRGAKFCSLPTSAANQRQLHYFFPPSFWLIIFMHAHALLLVASMSLIVHENVNHFNVDSVYFTISSLSIFHFELNN